MMICPEMLILLLFVEALEDNETVIVEGVLQVATFSEIKPHYSTLSSPVLVSITLILLLISIFSLMTASNSQE